MVHEVELAGYDVKYAGDGTLTLGTWDSYGIERLHITADSDWDGLTVLATFRIGSTSVRALMDGEGMVDVPPEATSEAGSGVIVFSGTDGEMLRVSRNLKYKVLDHDPIDAEDSNPTPSEWEQLVGRVDEAKKSANESAKRAEQSADSAAGSATTADASARQAAASGAAVEADKSAAQTAAQEAKKSETAAAGSASAAAASKNSAAESESAAASSAGDAASSKTAAAGSASAAATSASAAAASQAAAENSQKAAESSASASASSASNAKNSETSAAASAAAAARSAEEASTSAVAASNSESSALESKNAASGSASAAASSAEEAKSSQSAASESASQAASSKTAAESSASAAAASAEAAASSKTAAAGSQTEASASASAAAASAEAAESSKKAAAVSETEAETYKTAAQEAARQAQESAQLAQQISQGAMGWYATDATLREAHPTGENGQWAIVGSTDTIWTWDSDTGAWKNTSVKTDLSGYYTKEQADERFATSEQGGKADSAVQSVNGVRPGSGGAVTIPVGTKMTLLWTNPAPSSPFGAQSVNINGEGYDAFLVLGMDGNCILNNQSGTTGVLFGKFTFWNQTGYNLSMRGLSVGTGPSISFGECKILDCGPLNSGVFNQNCVPQKIYGINL